MILYVLITAMFVLLITEFLFLMRNAQEIAILRKNEKDTRTGMEIVRGAVTEHGKTIERFNTVIEQYEEASALAAKTEHEINEGLNNIMNYTGYNTGSKTPKGNGEE